MAVPGRRCLAVCGRATRHRPRVGHPSPVPGPALREWLTTDQQRAVMPQRPARCRRPERGHGADVDRHRGRLDDHPRGCRRVGRDSFDVQTGLDRLVEAAVDAGADQATSEQLADEFASAIGTIVKWIIIGTAHVLPVVASVATTLLLSLVVAFFFMKDGTWMWQWIVTAAAGSSALVDQIGQRIWKTISGYILGQAAIADDRRHADLARRASPRRSARRRLSCSLHSSARSCRNRRLPRWLRSR